MRDTWLGVSSQNYCFMSHRTMSFMCSCKPILSSTCCCQWSPLHSKLSHITIKLATRDAVLWRLREALHSCYWRLSPLWMLSYRKFSWMLLLYSRFASSFQYLFTTPYRVIAWHNLMFSRISKNELEWFCTNLEGCGLQTSAFIPC